MGVLRPNCLFDFLKRLADVFEGFLVKIRKCQLDLLAQRIIREKALHLDRRTAAEIEDARRCRRGSPLRATFHFANVRVKYASRLRCALDGDWLRNHRLTILANSEPPSMRIAEHHVYHFIIAGITQRLVKRPIRKRRAQQQGMQLSFAKSRDAPASNPHQCCAESASNRSCKASNRRNN